MTEAPGLFVSFEGIDGSGKSTQARLLAEALRASGREVVLTREPGGSPGAEEIRRLVLTGDRARWSPETEILLFTAARRDHLERTIRPALQRGAVVITDRFADSTRLYQGTTRGDLRALVDRLHALMIGVEPDLTVVIDMDPARALARSLHRLGSRPGPATTSAVALQEVLEAMRSPAEESLDPDATTPEADSTGAVVAPPEDRFETFGLPFQERIRQGFLDLAREVPSRIVVIDGDRPEREVAADVAKVALTRLGQG
ncbi:Thymidylate kinase [Rubellimicrobium mesophilum DSM 19309]|uniref:Thymidylate kinase n=1 Tax=Rubellimicrobium mesophilum DSM 19309 TaxID=442562 RepID=A0A017HUB5_9RHOB|nr:dTMP kinase [Rubellimicrobium mesophilum]EYD77753.1 Thymidylate kinase [Rubellimicrobium mesophilum DSM 19309]